MNILEANEYPEIISWYNPSSSSYSCRGCCSSSSSSPPPPPATAGVVTSCKSGAEGRKGATSPCTDNICGLTPLNNSSLAVADNLGARTKGRECVTTTSSSSSSGSVAFCGFVIFDNDKFESKVMSKYFPGSKYSSFTRRLRRWNFQSASLIDDNGKSRGLGRRYWHPQFQKGDFELARKMVAVPQARKKRKCIELDAYFSGATAHGQTGTLIPSSSLRLVHRRQDTRPPPHPGDDEDMDIVHSNYNVLLKQKINNISLDGAPQKYRHRQERNTNENFRAHESFILPHHYQQTRNLEGVLRTMPPGTTGIIAHNNLSSVVGADSSANLQRNQGIAKSNSHTCMLPSASYSTLLCSTRPKHSRTSTPALLTNNTTATRSNTSPAYHAALCGIKQAYDLNERHHELMLPTPSATRLHQLQRCHQLQDLVSSSSVRNKNATTTSTATASAVGAYSYNDFTSQLISPRSSSFSSYRRGKDTNQNIPRRHRLQMISAPTGGHLSRSDQTSLPSDSNLMLPREKENKEKLRLAIMNYYATISRGGGKHMYS